MNFRFKQTLKTLAVASAIASLVACGGGGGGGQLVTQDLPAITVKTSTQSQATQYAALLRDKTGELPAGSIFIEAGAPNVTAGTTFIFTAIPPGAPANAISGFKLTNAYGSFSGYIAAGSTILCGQGRWNSVTYPISPSMGDSNGNACFTINGDMTMNPYTNSLQEGSQTIDISVVITGSGNTVTSSVTATVNVTVNTDGTATIADPITGTSFTVNTFVITGGNSSPSNNS